MKEKKKEFKLPDRKPCVWMEAGVVSRKFCDNNFDCQTCKYDQAMQIMVEREREKSLPAVSLTRPKLKRLVSTWTERMMRLPAHRRKCRYMVSGEVSRKICPHAYECGSCSFDQMMQMRMRTASPE